MCKKGYKATEEHKRHISEALKGHPPAKTSFKKGHPPLRGMLGKHHSEETKKKISEWNKGRKMSEAAKIKMSISHGGFGADRLNKILSAQRRKERKAGKKKSEQCEICGAFGIIEFDHDHKTGKFRGWICHRCNWTLGLVKDNKEILSEMIEYLRNSRH